MNRLYIAGGSSEAAQCAEWMQRVREIGYEITHDWTKEVLSGVPLVTESMRREAASVDFAAVTRAHVVWVILPETKSEGAATELGIALALKKPVVVSGPWEELSRIFPSLAPYRFSSHVLALEFLRSYAPRRSRSGR